ncbi:unnamed protein product [Echinostoma caproni]|uniref:Uncharacterized protein n=1 Tax=Echinostoma caproni TaxID=27848 RepID=A0A3P8IL78_9TREM|nr:unnamed protein product [Echinostoma caproni]
MGLSSGPCMTAACCNACKNKVVLAEDQSGNGISGFEPVGVIIIDELGNVDECGAAAGDMELNSGPVEEMLVPPLLTELRVSTLSAIIIITR